MAYNAELSGRVREVLADRTDVEKKKMSGGLTFMVSGRMSCGVAWVQRGTDSVAEDPATAKRGRRS